MASPSNPSSEFAPNWWTRFWHEPIRAEGLALTRIFLGVALLTDLLFQYRPHLMEFFGAEGISPAGLYDAYQLRHWRWTLVFFNHDDPDVLRSLLLFSVVVTACWTIGFCTRICNVLVWLVMLAWINRNPNILNGGDDTLQVGIFLLMLSPSGRAFSIDAWIRRVRTGDTGPALIPPWSVRLIQIQLAVIYLTTGLVKLKGDGFLKGTWWDGTSVHYVLNYVTMSRWSYAQLPLPIELTAAMSYICVWWEALFPVLVLHRSTRWVALWFGISFHLGIWFTIEVGWFSFYTMSYYGVWVPDWFWERRDARRNRYADLTPSTEAA